MQSPTALLIPSDPIGPSILDPELTRRNNLDFFPVANGVFSTRKPYTTSIICGIDMEYSPDEANLKKNRLQSIQLAYVTEWGSGRLALLCKDGKRLTLRQIAKLVIKAIYPPPGVDTSKIHLVFIAHYAVAEWSHLADRDAKEILNRLAYIRKTVVTVRPIKYRLKAGSDVYISLFDTMLLAPESRKSLDRLSELLGPEAKKIHVPRKYKRRMDMLLRDDLDLYLRYAMRDAELSLVLFFVLQRNANLLVYGAVESLFSTLAAPAVTMYLLKHPGYADYRKALDSPDFADAMALARSGYHGGLNDCYFVGRTERFFDKLSKLFMDLDLKNCYPTAISLCPMLDTTTAPDVIPIEYRMTPEDEDTLRRANVPDEAITKVGTALGKSQKEFDRLLSKDQRCRRLEKKIRSICLVDQRRHLELWRQQWEAARTLPVTSEEHHLIPGIAHVRYSFPEGTLYPNLFTADADYGLVFTLRGEGVFTATEILQAEDAGATITVIASVNFALALDEANLPQFLFRDFMAELIARRSEADQLGTLEGKVQAEVLKTFANSVYGKIAQGIRERRVFRPSMKGSAPVDRSRLTDPVTAALITGAVRGALGAIFRAIELCNRQRGQEDQLILVSATTDGFILGVRNPLGESAERFYERSGPDLKLKKGDATNAVSMLNLHGCQDLLALMDHSVPIILLQSARHHLTGSPDILEVKQLVDKVTGIKTRGQIGELESGAAPLLAKCGHKVPEDELLDDLDDDLPVGIEKNNRERDWLVKHLNRMEEHSAMD